MKDKLPAVKDNLKDLSNLKPSDIRHIKLFQLVCMPPFKIQIDAYIEVYHPHLIGKELTQQQRTEYSKNASHILRLFTKSPSFVDLLEVAGLGKVRIIQKLNQFIDAKDNGKDNWWIQEKGIDKLMQAWNLVAPQEIVIRPAPPKESIAEIQAERESIRVELEAMRKGKKAIEPEYKVEDTKKDT